MYLPDDPGPEDLDPTNGWSVTGNSIQQALTHRSLTQYARDNESGEMILVPDLATDLGTPNEDFTEWTFTIRDDATWEDGKPITAEEVAWGIERSLDSEAFPSGPGTEYSTDYFLDADKYKGPYTDKGKDYEGIDVRRERPHGDHQDVQAVPGHGLLGRLHGDGPVAARQGLRPAGVRSQPAVDRPLQGRVVPPERGARARQERRLGRRLRPGPSPVRRQVDLQVRC